MTAFQQMQGGIRRLRTLEPGVFGSAISAHLEQYLVERQRPARSVRSAHPARSTNAPSMMSDQTAIVSLQLPTSPLAPGSPVVRVSTKPTNVAAHVAPPRAHPRRSRCVSNAIETIEAEINTTYPRPTYAVSSILPDSSDVWMAITAAKSPMADSVVRESGSGAEGEAPRVEVVSVVIVGGPWGGGVERVVARRERR